MVEGVADDRVFGPEDGLEQAGVGVEAGGIEDGVPGAEEIADPRLQGLVDGLGAADETHRRQAEAVLVQTGLGGLDERRMVGQAEIVVGAEIDHVRAVGEGDFRRLGRGDDTFVLIETDAAKRLGVMIERVEKSLIHELDPRAIYRQDQKLLIADRGDLTKNRGRHE